MVPSDLELHDAILRAWSVDLQSRTILLVVDAYLGVNDKTRRQLEIAFLHAKNVSGLADLDALETNSRAGNINYWVPIVNGTSYIYLNEGCLSVEAQEIRIREL